MSQLPHLLRVAVETPQHSGLGDALDYLSEQMLAPGSLVRVPLGKREVAGVVWPGAPAEVAPANLRPISEVLVSLPPLSERWCELVNFAATYYQRGCGEVALSVLPPELRKLSERQLQLRVAKLQR
ncbi:MAG: primosomal protein N', partial [Burkholderiaceae bacterium]